ncbi:hypothetical protein L1987_56572 [Smallanthus sonchifolius]|uniref:Uncharacterized protein n=1 Tax=Smallanthus sonchifolius TaxID=185202 RepID=A0ACB9ECS7_9ASTR|nr:hypothetical protein L1987_56572 [Smallanthus sonchifolius]
MEPLAPKIVVCLIPCSEEFKSELAFGNSNQGTLNSDLAFGILNKWTSTSDWGLRFWFSDSEGCEPVHVLDFDFGFGNWLLVSCSNFEDCGLLDFVFRFRVVKSGKLVLLDFEDCGLLDSEDCALWTC